MVGVDRERKRLIREVGVLSEDVRTSTCDDHTQSFQDVK